MNTAYFGGGAKQGDGAKRQASPLRAASPFRTMMAAFAFALAVAPVGGAAFAQEPTPAPTDVVAPPVVDPAPLEETVVEETAGEEAALEGADSPFSIQHIWSAGDFLAKTLLVVMVVMFSGTIYIAATKLVDQFALNSQMKKAPAFWTANSLDEGLDNLGRKNALRDIAEGAIAAANSSNTGLEARISRAERMSHQVGYELERVNSRLQAGMAFLGTVGAICPFVGLLGTVWGIVNALIKIGLSGDPGIDKVAGPVGEALIMTAIGLAVAVPAVIFYNLLGRRNKVIADQARHFAIDVEKLMASSTKA